MPRILRAEADVFKHQANATLSQANPMSGTKYEVLATSKRVRIIGLTAKCVWTVQPTPLEIHVTVDGVAFKWSQTDPVSNDYYDAKTIRTSWAPTAQICAVAGNIAPAFLLEGRNVKVEVEITGGTVSNLSATLVWAQIP